MDAPLAPALPPLGAGGVCDSSVLPVFLIPGYTMPSHLGRHSGGAKPLERLRFWSLYSNTFSICILEQYSDYIFSRYFLYELVVKMALYYSFFC